ncbi:MAG: hypothetical protein AABW54_00710 [Candidatus Micrarchaeota archaeon]
MTGIIGGKTLGEIMTELDNSVTAYKFSVANGIVSMSVDGVYGSLQRA